MEANNVEDHVLYELLVYKEWELEREKQKRIFKNSIVSNKPKPLGGFLWQNFQSLPWPEYDLSKAGSFLLPWQISVNPNGKSVAVLQDSVLEFRQSKDEYTTVVGRAAVPKDDRPQLRKMAWSPDSMMIAVASTDGSVRIFDSVGCLIFKIPLLVPEKPAKKLITGLEFISAREKKNKWELLIIYANGILECYNISSIDNCSLQHTCSLSDTGISCTAFSSQYSILFASVKPMNLPTSEGKMFSTGITAWRLLNEEPYYKKVFPVDDELSISRFHGKLKRVFSFISSSDCICKIMMAPSNEYLATLNASGVVYIWVAPSLRLHSCLEKFDFKKQKVLVSLSETGVCSHVVDIEWRKDSKLIIAWKNGTISIHDVNTQVVLTYFGPDFLHSIARLASASSLHGFLALECETENVHLQQYSSMSFPGNELESSFNDSRLKSEESSSDEEKSFLDSTSEIFNSTMYLITDLERYEPKRKSVKFVQKTYRLLGVKMTTPEELFERYLKDEEFDRAFEICQEYGLDVTKVYMRQWRTSEVTEESIRGYLASVEDDLWIINECLERVPETLSGAKKLIEFGLEFTDIEATLEVRASCELTSKQKTFVTSRLKLLNYARKLETYELIFDDNSYRMVHFGKFRNQSIVKSAIDFARSAQTEAVKLLMTHHGEEVLPYWLNILDNYPESIKPNAYQEILPGCDGDMVPVKWEHFKPKVTNDWALNYVSQFPDFVLEETHVFNKIYSFDAPSLNQWYKNRAIELEQYSQIIGNAVELLKLGTERHIQGLEELFYEFKMLSTLIYDLNMKIKYSNFHKKTLSQKLQMFVQEPDKFSYVTVQWVHPYLEHYAPKNSEEWLSLYQEFMIFNSKKIFGNVIEYFKNILHGYLHIFGSPEIFVNVMVDCIYAYEKLDQLEATENLLDHTLRWLNSLPEEQRERGLVEHLFAIQNELQGAEILIRNGYPKPLSFINNIKSNIELSENLVVEFIRAAIRNFSNDIGEWKKLFEDLINLQRHCFTSVNLKYCFEIYVSQMLFSGRLDIISQARMYLCCSKSATEEFLSFDVSVKIVRDATEYYFNAAMNDEDNYMTLAKACIQLIIDEHPLLKLESDLILAVKLLCDVGIRILPIQVRQTPNKMKLIDLCFEKDKNIYRSPQLIYKIAAKLQIFNPAIVGHESCITLCLAEEAFRRWDYQRCAEFCLDLIETHFQDGWSICLKLADNVQYNDISIKKKLIVFSLSHAPSRMLTTLMNKWRILNSQYAIVDLENICETCSPESVTNLRPTKLMDNLVDLTNIQDPIVILNKFRNLWRNQSFQDCFVTELSNDFLVVCPSFYSFVHRQSCNFSSLSFKNSELNFEDKFLYVMNHLLGFIIMASSSGINIEYELFAEVLIACSILSVSKDSALTLSFLLCLKDPNESEKFFAFYKESTELYQFKAYYLGLKEHFRKTTYPFKPPPEILSSLLEGKKDNQCLKLYRKLFTDFKNFCETSKVTSLEKGIDIERFKVDEKYKQDSIFGLALNEDEESLSLAIELAYKNNFAVHEVVISHIISLLISNKHVLGTQRMTDERIIDVLTENQEIFYERMIEAWPSLCGTNYQQLLLFFSIIKAINNDLLIFEMTPKEHISFIKKVKSFSTDSTEIDYKNVVSGEKHLIDILRPVLSDENSFLIAKFLKSLPPGVKLKHDIRRFYCEWAIEEFYSKCVNVSFRQCILKFESLNKLFAKCSSKELIYFVERTLLAEEVITYMDSGDRKQLFNSMINWCGSDQYRQHFGDVVIYLQTNLDLINKLWDDDYENYSTEIKKHIMSIEKHFRITSSEEEAINLLHQAFFNLLLSTDELVYLHNILDIKTPLVDLLQNFYNCDVGAEWINRFGWNEQDNAYSQSIPSKKNVNSEGELIKYYIDSLKKLFNDDLEVELFANVDLKDNSSCAAFFKKLLESIKTFDQLDVTHKFVQELSESTMCNKNDFVAEMLKKIITMSPDSELKFSLANDILENSSVSSQEYLDLLNKQPHEEPEIQIFIVWLCLHSESEVVRGCARKLINSSEDPTLYTKFVDLPKIATDVLIPHLCNTKFYNKLMDLLMDTENSKAITNYLEALVKSSFCDNPSIKKKVLELQLYLPRQKMLGDEIPEALLSFYSQLINID